MILLQAIRPKTLIASISPILIGTALSFDFGSFHGKIFIATLLTGFCIQILTNLANDYFDFKKGADTTQRIGPVRVMQAGLVSKRQMQWWLVGMTCLGALFGVPLVLVGGASICSLLLLALLLAYLYTAGPFPLAYLGLGDLFVMLFFGPVAVAATFYLQTHTLSMTSCLIGFAPGALSTVILTCNNLRDIQEDKAANKQTLIVRFGPLFGNIQILLCLMLSLIVPLFFLATHPTIKLMPPILALPYLLFIKKLTSIKNPHEYNDLLAKSAQLLMLYTILFCLCWTL
jgi:1,4-dihydroxy-2-naphthoate octaprenyltransferase